MLEFEFEISPKDLSDLILSLALLGDAENFKRWVVVGGFRLLVPCSHRDQRFLVFFFSLPPPSSLQTLMTPETSCHDVLPHQKVQK